MAARSSAFFALTRARRSGVNPLVRSLKTFRRLIRLTHPVSTRPDACHRVRRRFAQTVNKTDCFQTCRRQSARSPIVSDRKHRKHESVSRRPGSSTHAYDRGWTLGRPNSGETIVSDLVPSATPPGSELVRISDVPVHPMMYSMEGMLSSCSTRESISTVDPTLRPSRRQIDDFRPCHGFNLRSPSAYSPTGPAVATRSPNPIGWPSPPGHLDGKLYRDVT